MHDTKPKMLYFTGAHCSICKRMTPGVRAVAHRFRDQVDLVEVDVAADEDLVERHAVRAVPTLVAVDDGAVVGRAVGSQSTEALAEFFSGAASGRLEALPLSRADRVMRLGAAGAVGVIGFLAAQPLLLGVAAGLAVFAFWDRMPSRVR